MGLLPYDTRRDLTSTLSEAETYLYLGVAQSLVSGAPTAILWNAVQSDPLDTQDSVAPTAINVPAGYTKADIHCMVSFPANATGYRGLSMQVDGVDPALPQPTARDYHPAAGASDSATIHVTDYPVTAGQQLNFIATQTSGGALNATITKTFVRIKWHN